MIKNIFPKPNIKKINNYKKIGIQEGVYGDAIYETSSVGTGSNSWNKDYSNFPYLTSAFFIRGGNYHYDTGSGVFTFIYGPGGNSDNAGFRAVAL